MTAFVLMTAMPPTVGHFALIQFAAAVDTHVTVIVCTQPGEPYVNERVESLRSAVASHEHLQDLVSIMHIHQTLPQEPEDHPGFWDMWSGFLRDFGIKSGDCIVASEDYGATLAEVTGTTFIPYDIERSILYTKATAVREDTLKNFKDILPEFQTYLHRTVTIFGAESVGKTTTANTVARTLGTTWYQEWARPYMERYEPVVTDEVLGTIVRGQRALQMQAQGMTSCSIAVQDTDLFSTLGYWRMYNFDTVPDTLNAEAYDLRSDLYVILPSNIPFKPDPLRFGGDVRESSDQYWIDICEEFKLNYVVLDSNITERVDRIGEAERVIRDWYESSIDLKYERVGNT